MEATNTPSNHYSEPAFNQLISLLEAKSLSLKAEMHAAEEKVAAIRAKCAQPIIDAVLAASEFSTPYAEGRESNTMWIDFGNAVRSDKEAWGDVKMFSQQSSKAMDGWEEEDLKMAFGFGMLAGIMYASMTGLTISPPPALPKDGLAPNTFSERRVEEPNENQ